MSDVGKTNYSDYAFIGSDQHPDQRAYMAANLLAHVDKMPDTGDWHSQLKGWAEVNSTDRIKVDEAPVPDPDETRQAAVACRTEIIGTLNRMPYVRWDRLINNGNISVYGWIPRPDGKHDFVLVEWFGLGKWTFTTSSAHFDQRVAEALGIEPDNRFPCQRVADVFGDEVEWTTGATQEDRGQ